SATRFRVADVMGWHPSAATLNSAIRLLEPPRRRPRVQTSLTTSAVSRDTPCPCRPPEPLARARSRRRRPYVSWSAWSMSHLSALENAADDHRSPDRQHDGAGPRPARREIPRGGPPHRKSADRRQQAREH